MNDPWSPKEAQMAQTAADLFGVERHKVKVRMRDLEPELQQRRKEAEAILRDAGAVDLAPSNDGYNYAGAMSKGYSPEPDQDGNINLPAEFYNPGELYVSGHDLATGEKMMSSPADVAGERKLRHAQAKARREMNFLEYAGCVLSEGAECPVEGAMAAVQAGGRVIADATLSFFDNARQLTEAATPLELPEIAQVPNMGTWEGGASTIMQFLAGYGLVGSALKQTGAAGKMTTLQAEALKDGLATFMLDPSEGNLINLAKEMGWLDEEDVGWLDAKRMAEEGKQLQARAAATVTDAGLLGGATYAVTVGASKAYRKLQAFYQKLASANEDVIRSLNEAGSRMVQRGVELQKGGMATIRAGLPVGEMAGLVEEGVGRAVKGAAGAAERAAISYNSLIAQAQGYVAQGASRDDFITAMSSAKYSDELATAAWDEVTGATRQIAGDTMPDEGMISTRYPTAVKAEEDPLTHELTVGLEAAMRDDEAFKHNVDLMSGYDNYIRMGVRGAQAKAEQLVEHMKANLLRLFDDVPPEIRERSKLWYVGANRLANQMAEAYNISPESAAGVFAALSPQKDWFQNVSLGQRVIDIASKGGDWNDAMEQSLNTISPKIKNKAHQHVIEAVRGKSYGELTHPVEKALWIRVYDEGLNDRSYRIVTPEGELAELQTTKSGNSATAAWGSLNEISSAVAVLDDPSMENISRQMGVQHKVRNFYNNIIAPESGRGDVTIDTHAVAAALFKPLAGSDKEVLHNFGSNVKGQRGPKNSAITGLKGTYPLYAEAYRRAAAERGVLPREMQSVTWEAVRGLFADVQKTAQNKAFANRVWKAYKKGEITQEEAQNRIEQHFGGVASPDWHD